MDIDNILISKTISSSEKNYKHFIGYINDYKSIILPKSSTYVITYDSRTKWMYFFIEDDDLKHIMILGIKPAIV